MSIFLFVNYICLVMILWWISSNIWHGSYESEFNTFVDEINAIAAYQWWEGAIHSVLSVLAYPLAWSWQQWRRRLKLQRLREFVRSEYDHACLRSCRSRALYEGIKVWLVLVLVEPVNIEIFDIQLIFLCWFRCSSWSCSNLHSSCSKIK